MANLDKNKTCVILDEMFSQLLTVRKQIVEKMKGNLQKNLLADIDKVIAGKESMLERLRDKIEEERNARKRSKLRQWFSSLLTP